MLMLMIAQVTHTDEDDRDDDGDNSLVVMHAGKQIEINFTVVLTKL